MFVDGLVECLEWLLRRPSQVVEKVSKTVVMAMLPLYISSSPVPTDGLSKRVK